jgi:hypothetical protein
MSDLVDLFDDLDDGVGAHSLLGASGAHRWMHCPGSFRLTQQAPSRPPSIYASRGTLAHTYIEEVIAGYSAGVNKLVVPDSEVGIIRQVGPHAIEVDQDFVDGVTLMLDYVDQRVTGAAFRAEFQVVLDSYFEHHSRHPPVRLFGRVDLAIVKEAQRFLEIVDYKSGRGILVDPTNNPQMLYYAAGVLLQTPFPIEMVMMTVVQPHARTLQKIRSWTIDALDVLMWVDEKLIPAVDACAQPDAPLVTGPWCRFCPGAFTCPKLAEEANKMAAKEFSDDGISMPSDPAKLAEFLGVAERAETWINALRAFAVEQLKAQVRVPGWALEPTRPVRRWTDETRAGLLLTKGGLTLDEAYAIALRSPTQIEKLLKTKGLQPLWLNNLTPLVESHSSGVKLAHADIASDFPEEG